MLSAIALMAFGLVMGASVAGAQAAPAAPGAHAASLLSAQFAPNPGHFLSGPQPHVAGQSYAADSTNWSGQIATGSSFTGVTGPGSSRPSSRLRTRGFRPPGSGSTGGPSSSNSIIQTGTDQQTQNGVTSYHAWYELYPAPPVYFASVSPGDQMQAAIHQARHERLGSDPQGRQHEHDLLGPTRLLRRSR